MRVFVAGASGAIGRPLVRRLVEAGHQVTGMTRDPRRAEAIRAVGAEATVCDVFDPAALVGAVVAARPEIVVHELTSLPADLDPRRKGVYDANNRVRREGTRNLVAASASAGAARLIAQSVAFLYAPVGGWVKGEDEPVLEGAPGQLGAALDAALELERQVLGAAGVEGTVLRYGFLYGPGTAYAADGYQAELVRRRRFPIVGRGDGTFSFVHVEDAAAATVAACEAGPAGVFNVCDDEPAPLREWLPVYAEAVGARRPLRVPTAIARLVAGRGAVEIAASLRGASNERARRLLGWRPEYESWRRGFADALG